MEMVAQGLGNHLKLEQREHLFKLLEQVSSAESRRIAAKALGLVGSLSLDSLLVMSMLIFIFLGDFISLH